MPTAGGWVRGYTSDDDDDDRYILYQGILGMMIHFVPGYTRDDDIIWEGGGRGEVHQGAGAINSPSGHTTGTEDKVDKGGTRHCSA